MEIVFATLLFAVSAALFWQLAVEFSDPSGGQRVLGTLILLFTLFAAFQIYRISGLLLAAAVLCGALWIWGDQRIRS